MDSAFRKNRIVRDLKVNKANNSMKRTVCTAYGVSFS